MAASHFLLKRFDDVLVYLSSIKVRCPLEELFETELSFFRSLQSNFYSDDIFNFNYAQAQAKEEKWKDAEEVKLASDSSRNY